MSANVTFLNVANSKQRIMLPTTAIGEDAKGKFAYKLVATASSANASSVNVNEEQPVYKVQRVPVVLGKLADNQFEIKQGISVGDLIAKEGLNVLQSGDEVTLFNEKALAKNAL